MVCKSDAFLVVSSSVDERGNREDSTGFFSLTASHRSPGFCLAVYLCDVGVMNNYDEEQLRSAPLHAIRAEVWRVLDHNTTLQFLT